MTFVHSSHRTTTSPWQPPTISTSHSSALPPSHTTLVPMLRSHLFKEEQTLSTGCCTAGEDERVRSTSLYHCRQCSIVLKPRSGRIDYTVVCFTAHDCSRKLRKHSNSANWAWFKRRPCSPCVRLVAVTTVIALILAYSYKGTQQSQISAFFTKYKKNFSDLLIIIQELIYVGYQQSKYRSTVPSLFVVVAC